MSKAEKNQKSSIKLPSKKWIIVGIFLASLLLYSNTLFHGYTLDDAIVITENSFTKKGIRGIPDILSHDSFYGYFNEPGKAALVSGGRYRPLSQVMFALEYELFGLNPFWGHLVNILLYAFASCTVFWLTLQLFKIRFKRKARYVIAAATSLVFAAHPIHTEVVSNIKGRDEILAMICVMWAAILLLRINKSNKYSPYYIGGGLLFLLALLAKEIAVSFVLVIPLMYYFFREKKSIRIIPFSVSIMTALAVYLFLRFFIVGFPIGQSPPLELMNNPFLVYHQGNYVPLSFIERIPNVLYSLLKYVQLLLFPHPLTHDYYPRHIPLVDWSNPFVLISLLLFTASTVIAIWGWKSRSLWSFCMVYFGITIILVSNLLFPIGTNLSERFLFLPSYGWALTIGLIISRYRNKRIVPILWVLVLILFSIKTLSRNLVWKDNFKLFTTDVLVSANSAKAQNAAGGEYIARARSAEDSVLTSAYLHQAIEHLKRAIEIHPRYKNAFLLLGNAHYYLQEFEKAISFYDQALNIDGNYKEALNNRAITWRDLGRYYGETRQDLERAIEYLEAAELYLGDDHETARLLGVAYGNSGIPEKAIPCFLKAIALKPEDVQSYYNLSQAYFAAGDERNGNKYYELAKSLENKMD